MANFYSTNFGWSPALNFFPCNGRHSRRWHSCQLEQHFWVWEVLRPCNPLRRSSFYVSSRSHLSQVPLLRSSLQLAVSCKWWLCHQARLIVVRKLSAKSVFKGDDPFPVEQMLACLYTSEYWGVWLRPSTWGPGTREQAVEEAVPRNATLNEELDRKKHENIERQRRVGSVSKRLRKIAKGVETGKMSANMFLFGEWITHQLTLQLPISYNEGFIEISSIHT